MEVTSSQGLDVCKKVMEELLTNLLVMGIGQADALPPVEQSESTPVPSADTSSTTQDTEVDDGVEELENTEIELQLSTTEQILVVQQVKVMDAIGTLKVIYPSRIDLQAESYCVIRDYE